MYLAVQPGDSISTANTRIAALSWGTVSTSYLPQPDGGFTAGTAGSWTAANIGILGNIDSTSSSATAVLSFTSTTPQASVSAFANATTTGNLIYSVYNTPGLNPVQSTSATTGALQVRGGMGVLGNVVIGASPSALADTGNVVVFINSNIATKASANVSQLSGALQVRGGIATGGNLYVAQDLTVIGNVNFTAFLAASINNTPIGNASPSTGIFTTLGLSNVRPIIRPTLNFDFANGQRLPDTISYTRSGPGTRFDSRGNLVVVGPHTPRFTHDPSTLVAQGLLVEESRQNVLRETATFGNATVWTAVNGSIASVSSATTSPTGKYDAFKLTDDTSGDTHYLAIQAAYQPTLTQSATYTASAFVKAAEKNQVALVFGQSGNVSVFDLSHGNVYLEGADYASSITTLANGWYRIQSTVVKTNTSGNVVLALADGGATLYTGTGTQGVYVYGFQLEQGEFATSYIHNTTIANTRGQDTLTLESNEFAKKYNPYKNTVFVDATLGFRPHRYVNNFRRSTLVSFNDTTVNNRVSIVTEDIPSPVSRTANLVIYTQNAIQTNISVSSAALGSANITSPSKLAVYFAAGAIGRAYNGVANVYASSGNLSSAISTIQIGAGTGSESWNGTISKIQVYPDVVDGNELRTLTINSVEGQS